MTMLQVFVTVAIVDNFGIQFVRPFFRFSDIPFEDEKKKKSRVIDNEKLD